MDENDVEKLLHLSFSNLAPFIYIRNNKFTLCAVVSQWIWEIDENDARSLVTRTSPLWWII